MSRFAHVSLSEAYRQAWQTVRGYKMRSGLLILGVAIGVATLLGIVTIVSGLSGRIRQDIVSASRPYLYVARYTGLGGVKRLRTRDGELGGSVLAHEQGEQRGQRHRFVGVRRRQLPGQRLYQDERRAQVGFHMPVPAFAGAGFDVVLFEDRGVVDQTSQRPAQRINRAMAATGNYRFHPADKSPTAITDMRHLWMSIPAPAKPITAITPLLSHSIPRRPASQ